MENRKAFDECVLRNIDHLEIETKNEEEPMLYQVSRS